MDILRFLIRFLRVPFVRHGVGSCWLLELCRESVRLLNFARLWMNFRGISRERREYGLDLLLGELALRNRRDRLEREELSSLDDHRLLRETSRRIWRQFERLGELLRGLSLRRVLFLLDDFVGGISCLGLGEALDGGCSSNGLGM